MRVSGSMMRRIGRRWSDASVASFDTHKRSPIHRIQHYLHGNPAAVPLIVIMGLILQKPMQKIIRQSMNESALKNALLFETITGLETIKLQAAEGHTQRNWEELSEKASRTAVRSR